MMVNTFPSSLTIHWMFNILCFVSEDGNVFTIIITTLYHTVHIVTECIETVSPLITIECDPGSTISIIKGVCVKVPSCADYDPSVESQCDDSDKTAQWAPYCATRNPCIISVSCYGGSNVPRGVHLRLRRV